MLSKLTGFALENLPYSLKQKIRSITPNSIKRWMGAGVMAHAASQDSAVVTVKDGRKFNVIEDRLFLRVRYEKEYEPVFSLIVTRLLQAGDNVVDVGANFGWYSTLFAMLSKTGKVVAFEPSPRTNEILRNNIALNHMQENIVVRNSCAGDSEGIVQFDLGSHADSGNAHVVDGSNGSNSDAIVEVPVLRIDSDLSELKNNIAYLKIDVEGFEYSALRGAKGILDVENQPLLQIELNDDALHRAGSSRDTVLEYLSALGYSFWEATKNAELKKTNGLKCSDIFCAGKGSFGDRIRQE